MGVFPISINSFMNEEFTKILVEMVNLDPNFENSRDLNQFHA